MFGETNHEDFLMMSPMTVSLDLVKVTSAFPSKALTHFSPSVTTATNKASFTARNGVRITPLCEGNVGVSPWLGSGTGVPWGTEKAGNTPEAAWAHLLLFIQAPARTPCGQEGWQRLRPPLASAGSQVGPREGHGAVPPGVTTPSAGDSAAAPTEGPACPAGPGPCPSCRRLRVSAVSPQPK